MQAPFELPFWSKCGKFTNPPHMFSRSKNALLIALPLIYLRSSLQPTSVPAPLKTPEFPEPPVPTNPPKTYATLGAFAITLHSQCLIVEMRNMRKRWRFRSSVCCTCRITWCAQPHFQIQFQFQFQPVSVSMHMPLPQLLLPTPPILQPPHPLLHPSLAGMSAAFESLCVRWKKYSTLY